MILWGGVILASAPFHEIDGGSHINSFWMIAAPLGAIFTSAFFATGQLTFGVAHRRMWIYAATSAGMAIGSMIFGAAGGGGTLTAIGPPTVIAAGLAVFAWFESSNVLWASSLASSMIPVYVLLADPVNGAFLSSFALGVVLIAGGLGLLVAARGDKVVH